MFKFSALYFSYFALLGVLVPYLGVFLSDRGFSLFEVGQMASIVMITKIFAPILWATISDRYACHVSMVRFGALATLLGFTGFFYSESFFQYVFSLLVFTFFWNAVLPQIEVITLNNLGDKRWMYSRIRLWGSIGFILSVVVVSALFEVFGVDIFPLALALLILMIFFCSMASFKEPNRATKSSINFKRFLTQLRSRPVWIFYLVCVLLQVSHGAYYTYFSLYLEQFSYSKNVIGWLWGLGVLAEVVLFAFMHRWFVARSLDHILLFSLSLTGLRWLLTPIFIDSIFGLILLQCLHAFSFGAMHAWAIEFIHKTFELPVQGRAQALYSSVGFGVGGAVGAIASALIVDCYGYQAAFLFSACVICVAIALVKTTRYGYSSAC